MVTTMNKKLDRALNACVRDMAKAVRSGGRIETDSLFDALQIMGAVHRTPDGEVVEKLKFEWLKEQVLARFVARFETRLQDRLGPDPLIASELKAMFSAVLGGVDGAER
jgi:hypothetical protein